MGATVVMAGALLLLGACQRPQNKMIREFQTVSDRMLTSLAIAASSGSQYTGGQRIARGVVSEYPELEMLRGTAGSGTQVGVGYQSNPFADTEACVTQAYQDGGAPTADPALFRRKMRKGFRCAVRLLVASTVTFMAPVVPFLGPNGFAAFRFLMDWRSQSGVFATMPWLSAPVSQGGFGGLVNGVWLFQPPAGG